MSRLATLEFTAEELDELLNLARGRHMELERMLQQLEETEGLDATKFNARRQLVPRIEHLTDVLLKLEGARKEIG